VTDQQCLEVARITGLPFDTVYKMFKQQRQRESVVDVNGVTTSKAGVWVYPNWGEYLYFSSVTASGVVVKEGCVYLSIGEHELVVEAGAIQRALNAIHAATHKEEYDQWGM
jgi:hypothetical protein